MGVEWRTVTEAERSLINHTIGGNIVLMLGEQRLCNVVVLQKVWRCWCPSWKHGYFTSFMGSKLLSFFPHSIASLALPPAGSCVVGWSGEGDGRSVVYSAPG